MSNIFRTAKVRELLKASRTYYVLKTGSDSHNGLMNDAAHAFLTIQKGINAVKQNIDCAGYNITIQVGPGTWDEACTVNQTVGLNAFQIYGDTVTPSNCIWKPASGRPISFYGMNPEAYGRVRGFRLGSNNSDAIRIYYVTYVELQNLEFDTTFDYHINAGHFANVHLFSTSSIIGGAKGFLQLHKEAQCMMELSTSLTLVGIPNFSNAFLNIIGGSFRLSANPFINTATGKKYDISFGYANVAGLGDIIPGDVAGTLGTGGVYG